MATAKVFMTGRSQAVRLPKEFRFDTDEVEIWRDGQTVVLRPVKRSAWGRGFWESIRITDQQFGRSKQPPPQSRRSLGGEE